MIESVYGIKYTESIKQIRHTTSEPLPCGPATTYLKNLTVVGPLSFYYCGWTKSCITFQQRHFMIPRTPFLALYLKG